MQGVKIMKCEQCNETKNLIVIKEPQQPDAHLCIDCIAELEAETAAQLAEDMDEYSAMVMQGICAGLRG